MKPVSIIDAAILAGKYDCDQVIIIAREIANGGEDKGGEHVTTYGRLPAHSDIAAQIGDYIKHKIMHWPRPENDSNAVLRTMWARFGGTFHKTGSNRVICSMEESNMLTLLGGLRNPDVPQQSKEQANKAFEEWAVSTEGVTEHNLSLNEMRTAWVAALTTAGVIAK